MIKRLEVMFIKQKYSNWPSRQTTMYMTATRPLPSRQTTTNNTKEED